MKKKLVALLLAATCILNSAAILTACGDNKSEENQTKESQTEESAASSSEAKSSQAEGNVAASSKTDASQAESSLDKEADTEASQDQAQEDDSQGSCYYIDAAGDCHYLYSGGFGGYSRSYGDDSLILSLQDDIYGSFDELGSIEFSTYSFSDNYSDPHYIYNLVLYDTDYNEIKRDADSENLYTQIEDMYKALDNTFVTADEANEAMRKARLDAGLADEIYEAEVGYYE